MRFDTPAIINPIDQLKVVVQPLDRIDGPLKVSGLATYADEQHAAVPNQAYGMTKGVGELGICGVAGAIANAVYNATGVRLRDYPVTLNKLIMHLPAID